MHTKWKYYTNNYKDAFYVFKKALDGSGLFEEVRKKPDLSFIEHEPKGNPEKWKKFNEGAGRIPVFIYPHTPYSSYLWDGYVPPSSKIACNFVPSIAFKMAMETYHYPCRIEVIGFPRPLAISSVRLLGRYGAWIYKYDRFVRDRALRWIAKNRDHFERVTVFYTFDLDKAMLRKFEKYDFDFVCVARNGPEVKGMNTKNALKQLEGVDLFIGCNTLGYIAVSQGIPTILIGHDNEFPMHSSNCGLHYSEYEQYVAFPLKLHQMSACEVLSLCKEPDERVEKWKAENIGTSFDADRFLEVVMEYLW